MRVAGDQDLTLLFQFLFEVSLDLVGIFSEKLFLAFISILHLKEEVVSLIVSERTLKSYDVDLREIPGDYIPEFVAFFLLTIEKNPSLSRSLDAFATSTSASFSSSSM